jgi:heme-degrading monooxygenase HmoA
MFVLHVLIEMKPGHEEAAEKVFSGPFHAAITAQEGFRHVMLLRPDEGRSHVLSIAFENPTLQQKWVATELHGKVWSQMEAHFDGYSLKSFTSVGS